MNFELFLKQFSNRNLNKYEIENKLIQNYIIKRRFNNKNNKSNKLSSHKLHKTISNFNIYELNYYKTLYFLYRYEKLRRNYYIKKLIKENKQRIDIINENTKIFIKYYKIIDLISNIYRKNPIIFNKIEKFLTIIFLFQNKHVYNLLIKKNHEFKQLTSPSRYSIIK